MNNLFALQTALARAINADPVLCLAHAAAWLDPLCGNVDDIDIPAGEEDTVFVALHILRRAFPEIYFDALQGIRRGATYQLIDQLICGAVRAQGIPLENLEWISGGIPLPAYGVTLDEPEFYTAHPEVRPVLGCFGISPEPNPYNIVIPEIAYTVAGFVADDLLKQESDRWQQVGWLLKWLFSSSGNSSVDFDDETMCDLQPLSWETDDIAFARELIEEAAGIMQDVYTGLKWINGSPAALEVLSHNIRQIYKAMDRQKGRRDVPNVKLQWIELPDPVHTSIGTPNM